MTDGVFLGMANLRPKATGVPVVLHVLKDSDCRARHAPRVKAYPGKPHEGRETIIAIPTTGEDQARVVGKQTIDGAALQSTLEFVDQNWIVLLTYWYEPEFGENDLRANLRKV